MDVISPATTESMQTVFRATTKLAQPASPEVMYGTGVHASGALLMPLCNPSEQAGDRKYSEHFSTFFLQSVLGKVKTPFRGLTDQLYLRNQ